MPEFIWRTLAKFLARPAVSEWLINRAIWTPYDHLVIRDGRVCRMPHGYPISLGGKWYMRRWWLLRLGLLQIRIHNILSPDPGRDLHSHPWRFRTFILRGWYKEERAAFPRKFTRYAGDTAAMDRDEWHKITNISRGGVWTLFVTIGRPKGWGFCVNGKVVDHNEYTG